VIITMAHAVAAQASFDTPGTVVDALAKATASRIFGSANGTWIDSSGVRRDLFARRPRRWAIGARLAWVICSRRAHSPRSSPNCMLGSGAPFLSLCTDFTGVSTGVVIEPIGRSQ
jgi:hypothetical protein